MADDQPDEEREDEPAEEEANEDSNQYGGGEQDIDATEQTEMRTDDEDEDADDGE